MHSSVEVMAGTGVKIERGFEIWTVIWDEYHKVFFSPRNSK